ncbi:hypothetical protein Syun_017872 [Stephania yunnanensis]|uniref:MADS-box domain-containing protein n=1 Tax=Stephania yunnanensis TaxID=152371 RepID=A0AAP0J9G7_9MAGN
MEFISKEKSRNATFAKRKKGLKKKLHEFTTLCAVDAFLIIFYGNSSEPHIWPENKVEFNRILKRYHSLSVQDRSKRSENLEYQNQRRIKKREEELVKQRRSNGPDVLRWDHRMDGFDEERLEEQRRALDSAIEGLSGRICIMKGQDCIFEGGSGMIEYSHSLPDHGSFGSSVVPMHPQPFTCMKPPLDQQISTVNYSYDYRPLDFGMFLDVGPVATPLMCDPFDAGASWNFNTWTSMDRRMFCDTEFKAFEEIELANAAGAHASSSTVLFSSTQSLNVQPIQQWPCLSYTAPGTTQQINLPSNAYEQFMNF